MLAFPFRQAQGYPGLFGKDKPGRLHRAVSTGPYLVALGRIALDSLCAAQRLGTTGRAFRLVDKGRGGPTLPLARGLFGTSELGLGQHPTRKAS